MKGSIKKGALFAIAAWGFLAASSAFACTVSQDGLCVDVKGVQSGQTVNFTFTATFAANATSWIGTTMDAFSLQFGAVGNGAGSAITAFSATATTANAGGPWTGFKDKVSGNGCADSDANAVCYTVLPSAIGNDGAAIIAPGVYTWTFAVTFANTFNVPRC